MTIMGALLLFVASLWAGAQNTLAGGGSFVTFPALVLAGIDMRAANVTSTVALFPSQIVSGWQTRKLAEGPPAVGLGKMVAVSLVGGAAGALLLLSTPPGIFARLVPFLVLFATAVFAWGSFGRKRDAAAIRLSPAATLGVQAAIAVYGGYFGGGIGFMMVAALTVAGVAVRAASAAKNILAAVMNAAAVLVFAFSADVHWAASAVVFAGSMGGAFAGAWMLKRVPERVLRVGVVVLGLALTVGLFLRQA
jgi:uncharacterized membrane protein YfcA